MRETKEMDGRLMETNYKEYYQDQLNQSLEFQDFVAENFVKLMGIAITNFGSRKYQHSTGENVQGIEIKYDKKFCDTGNLYIETHEKSHPDNLEYVLSGIYRLDNSWCYVVGNYDIVYMLAKSHLKLMDKNHVYRYVTTPTSKGFLLPRDDADKYCIKKITF